MSLRKALSLLLAIALAVSAPLASAAPPKKGGGSKAPTDMLYRYRNEQGVLVINEIMPPEYARQGYEIITKKGQVVEVVQPSVAVDPQEVQRQKEMQVQMAKKDVELRKLYSSPADAERQRDRQMEAIGLKIDFARGQILQTTNRRKIELDQAAKLERQGKPVPQPTREAIDRLSRQIADQEAEITKLEADRERIREDFLPVVERLKVLYPGKAAAATLAVGATPAGTSAEKTPAAVRPEAGGSVAPKQAR